MKDILAFLLIFALGIVVSWALFTATAEVQERREITQSQCDRELSRCTTGAHCRVQGRDLLTITARGAK